MTAPALTRTLIDQLLTEVLGPAADLTLRRRLVAVLIETAVAGAASPAELLGLTPTVGPDHRSIQHLVNEHIPQIVGINDTTRLQVRAALVGVLDSGGGLDDQVKAIRSVFADASRARAIRIARTESGIFWHVGGRAQMIDMGARSHTWIATPDDRTREAHAEADGQCRSIDAPYLVGGESMWHPHDPQASIGNIVNCRCTETAGVGECGGKVWSRAQRAVIWKRVTQSIIGRERVATLTMRRTFREQRDDLLAVIARVLGVET